MSWADLTDGLNTACVSTFGEGAYGDKPVVYKRGQIQAFVDVIFSIQPQLPDQGVPESMEVFVKVSDVVAAIGSAPEYGDILTVRGQNYLAFRIGMDAVGGCKLTIKRT